ncbi:MAG: helix-turn-helix domain-containing protein [Petrimonas sp.]|jgi:transcriptional regulator with XRE-family HTH domain
MDTFGDIIKKNREEKGMFLRHVAAELGVDQALISKFERGERKPTKAQVEKFADFFNLDKKELIIAWLSDCVVYQLQDEEFGDKALIVAEEKLKYKKQKMS